MVSFPVIQSLKCQNSQQILATSHNFAGDWTQDMSF